MYESTDIYQTNSNNRYKYFFMGFSFRTFFLLQNKIMWVFYVKERKRKRICNDIGTGKMHPKSECSTCASLTK